ncbi:MAG: hypothetical protein Q8N10_12510 [Phenylobacterium sp.]|jgi:hypothetical protein|uniref:Uncharacterized protein n=1 Tax=Phenylobacterium ferrooxidans TaxID=2982689 RepID=A0ABW6CS60_9CAUL|nr:hypothetical protein [Phenylobacterium sp.]MDO8321646.1 hypothetical protein [Phenylobacterium sp.]MDO8910480.1 hypothetical protein [Phenylobacterium sp.]MDP2009268.1 hypothetical protein [Phenylobacterium sp.]MDP3101309.1 hypothetical protein [Phenylobacterium sp.]MDP3631857.1 hypothetical protein [Phenylobacterium sp.]
MTDQPEPTPEELKAAHRRKWFGRALLIGFGILLILQMIPFLMRSGLG